jgi:hypothetical protein
MRRPRLGAAESGGYSMRHRDSDELEQARQSYREAMRRYGEDRSQEARLNWLRAQRRLAEAVCAQLGVPL